MPLSATSWPLMSRHYVRIQSHMPRGSIVAGFLDDMRWSRRKLRRLPSKSYVFWSSCSIWMVAIVCFTRYACTLTHRIASLCDIVVHGWNYRVWLAEWAQLSLVDEFDFTTRKIYQNFSNYSAWQRRAHLFPARLRETGSGGCEAMLRNEVEMCRNAAWTEPGDQSVWFYQRWLFGRLPALLGGEMQMLLTRLAGEQLNSMLELVAEEPSAALAISFVVFLLRLIGDTDVRIPTLLAQLATVDPTREAYWKTQVEK